MKLPKLSLKPKLEIGLIINLILIVIVLIELYFGYALLYRNLNAQPTEVVLNKIVKVDLEAYQETSDLIIDLKNFAPNPLFLENPNPFKYK